ncbi:MAG: thioredoxin family protein [Candidatus Lokiarchaeota archaeon]|nr:thioredoxin family protein [Candidatus Lokiarchaeota archaeon]
MTRIEELKDFGIEIADNMKEGHVIIDVFTQWCGPCKFVSPILEKLKDEGLFKLIKIDLDENRPLGNKFGITAIPTLLFFKNGDLFNGIIEIQGQPLVRDGIMIGAANESTIREIVGKMN